MYLIIGLGNPEEEYSHTRHNMGFDVLNELSKKYDIKINKKKFNSLYRTGEIEENSSALDKRKNFIEFREL